eukprot:CAMPEP_0197652440 /NCGR_PEP_ID=MMETSP1338-20131121/34449_1 /TAXON_ID=43686 ORGANISM="Pelagodinium beii, Strain RCC1491" /NCGR_SAMPLE_ID=MMETSP1338 /ASSEMBLY_ACC=CAM_ASM_000754 /LENGTH=463 /DNA_ID=CAMNT_0043227315 /DNA_START=79 /DNA_END=1470 /DNA_ORIENTATION=-
MAAGYETGVALAAPDKLCDSDSTDGSFSGEPTVAQRLVEIPRDQGMKNVRALLERDMANRYQAKIPELNFLLQSERWFAKYLGMKYACSLNSGGIAISLGLEAMRRVLFPEDKCNEIRIYSNAFTFHAVPSACVEAGFRETLQLIEATPELVIDLDHLERCIKQDLEARRFAKGKMILVLSYMRGRVPNMHRVMELCKEYDMQLLEDSAHGYGCSFDGRMCGSFGVVSTISTQANKLVNTGEGGMVFTNNDEMQAYFIFSAGSYEELWRKHEELSPPEEVSLKYKFSVSNKSVRMTNIQGAIMYPQLAVMQERIDQHNSMYAYMVQRTHANLEEMCGAGASKRIAFIPQAHELVGPVYDSLQFRVMQADGSMAEKELNGLNEFLKMMQNRKYSMAKFSDPANARNYLSWQYLKADEILPDALPQTTHNLANVCDLRLLCHDTEVEMDKLSADLAECIKACLLK